jgi:DNA-binding response OmpR family regulator
MRIMLVEDEYLLNKAIKTYLSSKNMEVDAYLDGLEALDAISAGYDIFILDIDIPHINGIEILEEIYRLYPTLPVIMISATIDISMITKAYEKGCSDYLKKPFDIKELELKVNALTRSNEELIEFSPKLFYNKAKHELNSDGKVLTLTNKESKFLNLLILNRGKIVSYSDIESAVWGFDTRSVHIRQLVNRLRSKLPKELIQNRVGEGYIIL